MPIYNESITDYCVFIDSIIGETEIVLDAYGSINEANTYFDNRLKSKKWKKSSIQDKKSAMSEATRLIDRLNFIGEKTDPDQFKQFPRSPNTTIPKNITIATYEISLSLLLGVDPDLELDNLPMTLSNYGGSSGVRSQYDRSFVLDHIAAGIPSSRAWQYLRPYLRNPQTVKMYRV
jgi:hypothetical protein